MLITHLRIPSSWQDEADVAGLLVQLAVRLLQRERPGESRILLPEVGEAILGKCWLQSHAEGEIPDRETDHILH